jgi:hypothetical protein
MPAFFRELLVLELDASRPRALIAAHGVMNVEKAAVTGVAVGDERFAHAVRHALYPRDHVAIGRNPRIGQAEVRSDGAVAGQVKQFCGACVRDLGRDTR